MKRTVLISTLLVFALAAAASAQFRGGSFGGLQTTGIPASVTSPTAMNPTPGIPASVTSPRPFTTFQSQTFFNPNAPHNGFHHNDGFHRPHHFNNRLNTGVVFLYPGYLYDYGDDQQQYQQPQTVVEPEAPAQTVFENRPGYKTPTAQTTAAPAQNNDDDAQAKSGDVSAEPAEPETLLVFKDGHQLEIGNYVIVGDTLYNMSGAYRSYKIPLAQLDLDATVKANEDRGIEFHLPKKSA